MLRVLVELTAYDPGISNVRTLRLTTTGTAFTTGPGETPASTTYLPLLASVPDPRRRQTEPFGVVAPATGDIVVLNADGAVDAWEAYAFDGRTVTMRVGPDAGAYPSAYPVTFTGRIDRAEFLADRLVLRVRDETDGLRRPLQDVRFSGDNVPPDGVEGEAELEGQPKPLVYGRVRKVPLVPVNPRKLIYQVSDTQCSAIQAVRDGSVLLGAYTPVDWANVTTISAFNVGGLTPTVVAGDALLVGGQADLGASTFVAAVARTTDGSGYTVPSSPFTTGATGRFVTGLAYDPATDVVVAVTSTGEVATSANRGTTWTIRTPAAAAAYRGVRWDALRGLFIALGDSGVIHTSPTGTTWTARTSGTTDTLWDVAVDGPVLVATGADGRIVRSADGLTWATFTAGTGSTFTRQRVRWDGFAYVAVRTGTSDRLLLDRSADGSGWVETALPSPTSAAVTTDLLIFNGWTIVGRASSVGEWAIFTSRDGVTFTEYKDTTFTLTGGSYGIAAFGDRFYAFGDTNKVVRSGAPSAYASLADLEDDDLAPTPGMWKWIGHATGTYVRLGSRPFFDLTADATEGATAAARSAGQVLTRLLGKAGYGSGAWESADITALDAADSSEVGLYLAGRETVEEAVDRVVRTVGAWWSVGETGKFRVQQFAAPSGSSTFSIVPGMIADRLEIVAGTEGLGGVPRYRTTLTYALSDTLALDGAVVAAWVATLTQHPTAGDVTEPTWYASQGAAQAEATRRNDLLRVTRRAYRVTVPLGDVSGVRLGSVGTLTYPRFGLSGGVLVRVIGVEPDARRGLVTLTLWR